MDDMELLKHLKESAKDDFDYFSNPNKPLRERWVASEFISKINIVCKDDEFGSPEQDSKIDVTFRDAKFQIKEITDETLRRGKILKGEYESLEKANSLDDPMFESDAEDIPPVSNMYDLVLQKTEYLSNLPKYIKEKRELDLLIYVTRTRATLIQEGEIDSNEFLNLGWRSVSCLNSKQAMVLFSSQNAPDFLQQALGTINSVKDTNV
jgi:hypothetical protein